MADLNAGGMPPLPGIDPLLWAKAQQLVSLGGQVAESGLNGPTQPQNMFGARVAARVSPLSGLASLAKAYMGAKMQRQGQQLSAEQYAQGLDKLSGGGGQGSGGGSGQSGGAPAGSAQQNPYNPQGLPAWAIGRLSPADYLKYLQGNDTATTARLANMPVDAAERASLDKQLEPEGVYNAGFAGISAEDAARAKFQHDNAIDVRGGGEVRLPGVAGSPPTWIRAPNLSADLQPVYDANGNVIDVRGFPGAPKATADLKSAQTAAEQRARELNTIHTVPNQSGGSTVGWGSQLFPQGPGGTPSQPQPQQPGPTLTNAANLPAPQPGGAPAPGASTPRYFPTPAGAGSSPIQAPPPAAAANDFPGAPMLPQGPGTLGAPGRTASSNQELRSKEYFEKNKEFQTAASTADVQNARIDEARRALLNGANTGPLSPEMTEVQGVLHEFAPSIFDGEAATNTGLANKNLVQNAIAGAKVFQRPTASEVFLMKNEANPSVQQTREAALRLMDQQTLINGYNKQKLEDWNKWVGPDPDHPLRAPELFDGWYSANRPLRQYAWRNDLDRQVEAAGDAGKAIPREAFARLLANPSLKAGFVRQYGYTPPGYEGQP